MAKEKLYTVVKTLVLFGHVVLPTGKQYEAERSGRKEMRVNISAFDWAIISREDFKDHFKRSKQQ